MCNRLKSVKFYVTLSNIKRFFLFNKWEVCHPLEEGKLFPSVCLMYLVVKSDYTKIKFVNMQKKDVFENEMPPPPAATKSKIATLV